MIQNHNICIMKSLTKMVKKNLRPSKVWIGLLLFIEILLKQFAFVSKRAMS